MKGAEIKQRRNPILGGEPNLVDSETKKIGSDKILNDNYLK